MCVAQQIEYEYTKYSYRGCSGRNELYVGSSWGRADCQSKCSRLEACISFEFWSSTEGSAAHPNWGQNFCQLSSSCTAALSVSTLWTDSGDLYVKGEKRTYVCMHVCIVKNGKHYEQVLPTIVCKTKIEKHDNAVQYRNIFILFLQHLYQIAI